MFELCVRLLRRRWLLLLRQPNLWEILSESRNWTGDGQCAQDPTITLLWLYFELSLQVPLRQPEHAWRGSLLCNNCRQHWSDDKQHERSQRCVQRQGTVLKRILIEIHCKWCFLKCWEITKRSIAAGRLHQSISCVPKNSKGAWNQVGEQQFSKKKKKKTDQTIDCLRTINWFQYLWDNNQSGDEQEILSVLPVKVSENEICEGVQQFRWLRSYSKQSEKILCLSCRQRSQCTSTLKLWRRFGSSRWQMFWLHKDVCR